MGIELNKTYLNNVVATIVLLLSVLVLPSCNEFPNEVGSVMATDSVSATTVTSLDDTTLIASSKGSLTRSVQYNSGNLYIGATSTARAATLIRFVNIPDSLKSLTESQIDSVRIYIMPHRYVFGDSVNNTLEFNVVALKKAWIVNDKDGKVKLEPRWNDLFTNGITPSTAYFGATLGTFNGTVALNDTLKDATIPCSTNEMKSLLVQWFKDNADTATRGNIYGIGFVPTANSKVIREFNTRSTSDQTSQLVRMNVYYRRPSDAGRDSLILLSGNDATFCDADLPDSTQYISTQSLLQTNGEIVLNINSLPKDPTVAKAQLKLYADTTMFQGGNNGLPTSIMITVNVDYDTSKYDHKNISKSTSFAYYATKSSTSNEYTSDNFARVLEQARRDNAILKSSGKITILVYANNSRFERSVFYTSNNPDKNKRPKLIVSYLTRPTFGGKQ